MAIGQMRQTVSSNQDVVQLQGALNDQFSQISQVPFMGGILLSGVNLSSGLNNINHKLGRTAKGYFIVSNSSSSTFYNGTFTDSVIPLYASGVTTVNIWVF